MLKRLLNFIGRTNVLLASRNQEVSLLWVYMALQHMRAQGYFAQLKVRWNYNLNFTGHALLKLEYEAEQESQAKPHQTSAATALDSNQKLSAYSARTAVYTPYAPTDPALLSTPSAQDNQPSIFRTLNHPQASAATLSSASASAPPSATANVTANSNNNASAAATLSPTDRPLSPHASPNGLPHAAHAQARSHARVSAQASGERTQLTNSVHVQAKLQAQTLPQPQIQVQTQEQAQPQANPQSQAQGTVILVLNSLGLGSLDGPLPLEMTQLIHHLREDENVRLSTAADLTTEQGLVAFLDLISARMFYYFEQVLWRSSMAAQLMQPQAPLNYLLLALTGNNSNLSPLQLDAALPLLIGPQQRSAEALKLLLSKILHLPVEIKPFEFAMYPIPRQMRSRLLHHSCILGGNTQLGAHYATFNRKFSVRLGPMSFEQFSKLLTNQSEKHSNQIQALCEMVLKRPLDCSLVYLIETKTIPRLSLGHAAAHPISLLPDAATAPASELNAHTTTIDAATDAVTASKLNAPTATLDAAAKANAEVKLTAKAAYLATSSSTLSPPSTTVDATLAHATSTLSSHAPLPEADLSANLLENQTDLPASYARALHPSTAPAPRVAQNCSDQNGPQLKIGLGQGLLLRNSHTLPVLGLVRQRIHPHPH